jgi:hypothetical protein
MCLKGRNQLVFVTWSQSYLRALLYGIRSDKRRVQRLISVYVRRMNAFQTARPGKILLPKRNRIEWYYRNLYNDELHAVLASPKSDIWG